MDEINYKKWGLISSLTIEQVILLWLGRDPDKESLIINKATQPKIKKEEIFKLSTVFKIYFEILKKEIENSLKRTVSKNEIKDFFLKNFNEIPEELDFLFNYEQKELLEAINNTLSPKKQSDLALLKQVETLGAALAITNKDTDWNGTKIWNEIEKNQDKFSIATYSDPKRQIDLINKYLKILRKK